MSRAVRNIGSARRSAAFTRSAGAAGAQPQRMRAGVDDWPAAPVEDPFDRVIEWGLMALLAFMPLALGAVEAWSELVVMLAAAALGLVLAAKLLVRRRSRFVWSWTYVPMALFAGLLALQLAPLPAGVVALISPGTAQLRTELLADLPGDVLRRMTLSFYPYETARALRLVLAASTIFVVVVNVFRRPRQVKRLLIAIGAIGGAVAAVALLQDLTGAKAIYWTIYNADRPAIAGPFINHNNFAQYMNLSIGAALAVLLVRLREVLGGGGRVLSRMKLYAGDPELRPAWIMGAVTILGAAAVMLSVSRMGMISLLIAGAMTGAVLALRREGGIRGWVLAPIALAVFVAVLWLGFDRVYDRLATLRSFEDAEGGRVQTLKDLPAIWRRFPLLGIGAGAHETVYPMFDRHTDPYLTAHVENEYAQVLEEAGGLGLALVAAFVVMVALHAWRAARTGGWPLGSAALGLSFGLAAVMIHSASDFGQRLPAVAGLSAVSCGLLLSLSRMAREQSRQAPAGAAAGAGERGRIEPGAVDQAQRPRPDRVPPLRLLGTALAACAFAWQLSGAASAAQGESAWRSATAAESHFTRTGWATAGEAQLQRMLGDAARAVEEEPGNVHYRYGAAAMRWRVLSTDANRHDPQTGDLLLVQEDVDEVRDIVRRLHAARPICPTFGATLSLAGQLETFALGDSAAGAAHVQAGYRLSPNNPTACFVAGRLDAMHGRIDASLEKMRAAVRLDRTMFSDVADLYIGEVGRPDLAIALAEDDVRRLLNVAEALQAEAAARTDASQEFRRLADDARASAMARLRERVARPDAPAAALAQMAGIYAREGDAASAADYYGRALAAEYGQTDWRLARARALAQAGRVREAIEETEVCLRLRPNWAPAKRLLAELSVLPGAVGE